jgi:hypothetical protein
MLSGGVLPEDAPDPRLRTIEQLREMPVPILGLVPQPNIQDWGALGVGSARSGGVIDQITAVIGYTLWRNPADRSDPGNLADLDEQTQAALDMPPPWPRPRWLIDQVERMRYPMLWEAVRTTWQRDDAGPITATGELVGHVNNVLVNRYHTEWTRDPAAVEHGLKHYVDERHIERDVPVTVNGTTIPGLRIDTDPFVFGIGADLGDNTVLTTVIDREALPFLTIEFANRP